MWLVWLIAYYAVANDYIIPSFSDTMKSMGELLAESAFWTAFGYTLLRTAEAFVLSFLLAAVLAALSVCSKGAAAFIRPVMIFLRTLPTLAVVLILLIWTNRKIAPVIVTLLVLLPAIYAQITAAAGDIDGDLIEMADVYRIPRKTRLFKIYLPLVSPNILSQAGANISMGLKVMISAEVLSKTFNSLGNLMQNAREYLEMPRLAALTLMAVLLGLILDFGFSQFTYITKKWSVKGERND